MRTGVTIALLLSWIAAVVFIPYLGDKLLPADVPAANDSAALWLFAAVTVYGLAVVFLRDHRRLQRYTYVWFLGGLALGFGGGFQVTSRVPQTASCQYWRSGCSRVSPA